MELTWHTERNPDTSDIIYARDHRGRRIQGVAVIQVKRLFMLHYGERPTAVYYREEHALDAAEAAINEMLMHNI